MNNSDKEAQKPMEWFEQLSHWQQLQKAIQWGLSLKQRQQMAHKKIKKLNSKRRTNILFVFSLNIFPLFILPIFYFEMIEYFWVSALILFTIFPPLTILLYFITVKKKDKSIIEFKEKLKKSPQFLYLDEKGVFDGFDYYKYNQYQSFAGIDTKNNALSFIFIKGIGKYREYHSCVLPYTEELEQAIRENLFTY